MPIHRRHLIGSGLVALAAGPAAARSDERSASPSRPVGGLELARLADAPSTPTGLAISRGARVFVMMPRFTADVPVTAANMAFGARGRLYIAASHAIHAIDLKA